MSLRPSCTKLKDNIYDFVVFVIVFVGLTTMPGDFHFFPQMPRSELPSEIGQLQPLHRKEPAAFNAHEWKIRNMQCLTSTLLSTGREKSVPELF